MNHYFTSPTEFINKDLSLEEQARYCDQICYKLLNDNKNGVIKGFFEGPDQFDKWNVTSIGNLAAIVLRCTDEECRTLASDSLARYKEYVNQPKCTIM